MKTWILGLLLVISSSTVWAASPSVIGGKPLGTAKAHNIGAGWPSLFYEWWHGGKMDWALGAEIVYGDWSGAYSRSKIGLGLNVPLRWHLLHTSPFDVGFRFTPGALMAKGENNKFLFGVRGDMGVPVSVVVAEKVSLITGVSSPMAVYFPKGGDPFFVLPILPRIGVEVTPDPRLTVWALLEIGPAIGISSATTDVDVGIRGSFGVAF